MVIPMNIYYYDNSWYHELIFLLQFAAFAALALQNYGFTLDVTTAAGLCRMNVAVTSTIVVMLYSRVIRYIPVCYALIMTFIADNNTYFLYVGCAVIVMMGIVSMLFII